MGELYVLSSVQHKQFPPTVQLGRQWGRGRVDGDSVWKCPISTRQQQLANPSPSIPLISQTVIHMYGMSISWAFIPREGPVEALEAVFQRHTLWGTDGVWIEHRNYSYSLWAMTCLDYSALLIICGDHQGAHCVNTLSLTVKVNTLCLTVFKVLYSIPQQCGSSATTLAQSSDFQVVEKIICQLKQWSPLLKYKTQWKIPQVESSPSSGKGRLPWGSQW